MANKHVASVDLAVMEAEKAGLPNLAGTVRQLADHTEIMAAAIKEIQENQKEIAEKILRAFAAGDVDGHRRYHEALLRRAEANEKLALAIREKTIIGLVWITLSFVAVAVWHEVGTHIKGLIGQSQPPAGPQ